MNGYSFAPVSKQRSGGGPRTKRAVRRRRLALATRQPSKRKVDKVEDTRFLAP
ncbi:MAG: hypothetical protein V4472_25605 [Pseudomonadota bacterium]